MNGLDLFSGLRLILGMAPKKQKLLRGGGTEGGELSTIPQDLLFYLSYLCNRKCSETSILTINIYDEKRRMLVRDHNIARVRMTLNEVNNPVESRQPPAQESAIAMYLYFTEEKSETLKDEALENAGSVIIMLQEMKRIWAVRTVVSMKSQLLSRPRSRMQRSSALVPMLV